MTQVIAVMNEKGGVGKTATATTLAYLLAKQKKKVLLMHQMIGGIENPNKEKITIATLINMVIQEEELPPMEDYIFHNENGVDLIAANSSLFVLERNLCNVDFRETNLRQRSFTDLSHSERAYCLMEHYEAMKKQGKRSDIIVEIKNLLEADEMGTNLTSSQVGTKLRSDEKIAKEYALSKNTVARYIRIATLEEILMELLDEGRIDSRVIKSTALSNNRISLRESSPSKNAL